MSKSGLLKYINVSKSGMLKYIEEQSEVFTDALGRESDRALGIVAVCWLDNLLERLIRASYIKEPQVKSLFKDEHILQTFFAKVNIAYYSGLIPRFLYHDLKLIGEIRNKFAHEVVSKLTFDDEEIRRRAYSFTLRPEKKENEITIPKIKYISVVTVIGGLLIYLESVLAKANLPKLRDLVDLDKTTFHEIPLTKAEANRILAKFATPPKRSS